MRQASLLVPMLSFVIAALPACRGNDPRAPGKAPANAGSTSADAPGKEEPVDRLVARLNADDPQAPQARDALLARWKRLTDAERATAADAVLGWFGRNLARLPEGGARLLPQVLALVAPAASESALAGFARAHAARVLVGAHADLAPAALAGVEAYAPHLRLELVAGALLAWDVTLPRARQEALLAWIVEYTAGPERKKAGEVILKNLQVKEKISLEAVRALGLLRADGAVDFLRLFVQMDVPADLRRACVEAIGEITDDPAAVDALVELARPLFLSLVAGDPLKADLLERARWALTGLEKARACKLPPREYTALRQAYRAKPAAALADQRTTALPALVRLMHCADPKKTRADVPAADRKAAGVD